MINLLKKYLLLAIGGLSMLASTIFSISVYPLVPEDAKIPIQFSFTGEVNNYLDKNMGLFALPVVLLLLTISFFFRLKQNEDEKSRLPVSLVLSAALIGLAVFHFFVINSVIVHPV